MNQQSLILATLIRYQCLIRDTLEYTLVREKYDLNVYKNKKRAILLEVENKTPLKNFIEGNGENGKRFEENLREFHVTIYGDESSIIKVKDDVVTVDHTRHLDFFRRVMPLHQTISGLIFSFIEDCKKNNIDVARAEECAKKEERFFSGVAFITLSQELIKTFNQYNEERKANDGKETKKSLEIGGKLTTLINIIDNVSKTVRVTEPDFAKAKAQINDLGKAMTGKLELDLKEFPTFVNNSNATLIEYIRSVEKDFHANVDPFLTDFLKQVSQKKE